MIDTEKFVNKLYRTGYTHLCVVPCSFAKNLINASINNSEKLEYIPCASEAVACSIAAGLKMSGMRPIVIVQSSGLTNMGSCITSLLKPYEITFPIIVSWRTYKSGDSEIQHEHLATKLPDLVSAYGYDYLLLDNNNFDNAVEQINTSESSATILLLQNNTFTSVELSDEFKLDLSGLPLRSIYLKCLGNLFNNSDYIFIGTTGNTAREMYAHMPNTNNVYMAGNMGGALSLGLGMAKSGRKVIVCGGDAEFVMHMGGLTTAARYNSCGLNMVYILFDNQSNKSTGGQRTYQEHIDYIGLAKSSGLSVIDEIITDNEKFETEIKKAASNPGINFIHVKCSYDPESPRPPLTHVKRNSVVREI